MKLTHNGSLFVFECRYPERDVPKESGFHWNGEAKRWETKSEIVARRLEVYADTAARYVLAGPLLAPLVPAPAPKPKPAPSPRLAGPAAGPPLLLLGERLQIVRAVWPELAGLPDYRLGTEAAAVEDVLAGERDDFPGDLRDEVRALALEAIANREKIGPAKGGDAIEKSLTTGPPPAADGNATFEQGIPGPGAAAPGFERGTA